MAIHGSQGSLNLIRQPKPRHEYAVPRYRVTLVRENRAVPPSLPLNTSVTAAAILRPLFAGLDREQFLVCGLDAKHSIIGVNVVSIGSLTLAIVHPREVFKPLILMNAAAWICAHNHPSGGDVTPSPEDRVLTSRLQQGAELLGIRLLDHLILTDERCYSFADQGWPGA
ncbi:MAG: JAB domain-containing protein [Nitrospirota bacterium]